MLICTLAIYKGKKRLLGQFSFVHSYGECNVNIFSETEFVLKHADTYDDMNLSLI